jgi:uncharacterized membrane protein
MQNLQLMSRPERKKFLSMDLAERMIRVEQKVSAAFNKTVPYRQTEYFKNMSLSQQQEFERFLKNKGRKKVVSILSLVIPLLAMFFLSSGFTGNAVKDNLGGASYNLIFISLIVLFVVLVVVLISAYTYKKKRDEKFERNTKVIDDILLKKRVRRK